MKKFVWIITALSVAAGVFYWRLYSETPMMAPDSLGYLQFSANRTPGYPLFLWCCQGVLGSLNGVPTIQLTLLLASIAYLTIQAHRLFRSWVFSLLLWLLLAGNIELIKYAFLLLTESLTLTLLMCMLGITCQLALSPSKNKIVMLSSLLGLAILLRPASYGWIGGLLLAGILSSMMLPKLAVWRKGASVCLPLLLILGLGSIFNYHKHGFFGSQSFLGEMLIGKVGVLATADIPSRNPTVLKTLADYSFPIQVLLQKVPSWRMQYLLSAVYADQYRYGPFATQLNDTMQRSNPTRSLDKQLIHLAVEIITARVIPYLHNVLIHYMALWQVWDFGTPAEVQQMARMLQQETPLPHKIEYPAFPRQAAYKNGSWIAWPLRIALFWVFCCTIGAPCITLFKLCRGKPVSQAWYIMTVAAGFVQGAYVLTALIQSGIPRFFMVMWPGIALIGVLSLWSIFNTVQKGRHAT